MSRLTDKLCAKSYVRSAAFENNKDHFQQILSSAMEEGAIPPLKQKRNYTIFKWSPGFFSHWSIVVMDQDNERCFTLELRIISEREEIIPYSQVVEIKHKNKWEKEMEVSTTVQHLADIAVSVIKDHGSYNALGNSCQHFVLRYLKTLHNESDP